VYPNSIQTVSVSIQMCSVVELDRAYICKITREGAEEKESIWNLSRQKCRYLRAAAQRTMRIPIQKATRWKGTASNSSSVSSVAGSLLKMNV